MWAYIVRRLLTLIPTLLIVTVLVFLLVSMMPGDITEAVVGHTGHEEVDRDAILKQFGLDQPLYVQYGRWMGVLPRSDGRLSGLLQGSLGTSWWTGGSVVEQITKRWPVTLQLGLLALIVAQLVALPLGTVSALRQETFADYASRSFAIAAISIPGFWVGTVLIVYPAIWWNHLQPIFYVRFTEDPLANLGILLLPVLILGMELSGITTRMLRSMVLEVLRQDYVRTAWAKGLPERTIVTRHTLKNALIPVITIVGLQVPIMIGGAVIIESLFNLPGMGRLLIDAVTNRDEPLVMGLTVLISVALVLINLLVDLTYSYFDPRIHYR